MRSSNLIVLIGILLATTSCAVFKNKQMAVAELSASDSSSNPSISYDLKVFEGYTEETTAASDELSEKINGQLFNALQRSKYFGRVAVNDADPEITLDVSFTSTRNKAANTPKIISYVTLLIIPSWAKEADRMQVTAKRGDSLTRTYEYADSTTLIRWIPMVFAMPFKGSSVTDDVRNNMFNQLIVDMEEDGFFRAALAP